MADYIDKKSWCKDGYHGDKFHHKNVTSKRCPGCGDRNPDFIDNDKDGLSDAEKDSEEPRRPPNPNRERFTRVPDNADYRDLTESPKPTPPPAMSLPGPQRPYIHKGIGEQGRQDSITKDPVKGPEKLYSATKQFKLDVSPCRQVATRDGKGFAWSIKDNGVTCVVGNDLKGDITALLLDECREALKRNMDKKFMTPTYPESDIEIPGEWTLATSYDAKSGPTWLDKGMVFNSVKELLEGIYSDIKKGSRFVVWLGFRMSDEETLVPESPVPISASTTPAEPAPPKTCLMTKKTKIKKEPGLRNNNKKIKQEKSSAQSNAHKRTASKMETAEEQGGKTHSRALRQVSILNDLPSFQIILQNAEARDLDPVNANSS